MVQFYTKFGYHLNILNFVLKTQNKRAAANVIQLTKKS